MCFASVGSEISRELWRHSEQRGYYTRLQSPVSTYLYEKGIASNETCFTHPGTPNIELHAQVPSSLSEGIIFDVVEIFRGSGNWTLSRQRVGLVAHDGFDTDGSRLRVSDLSHKSTVHELLALAMRKVVREWHSGLPCVSFGALRRPQVRSNSVPFGFNPQDQFTAWHNMLAHRNAFILTVAVLMGQFISVEQPGGSRLYRLHCYKALLQLGCVISHFHFCAYGSAFQKHSKWLRNKPWLVPLDSKCTCSRPHFVIKGNFTQQSIEEFESRCYPSSFAVFGRSPRPGDRVSSSGWPVEASQQSPGNGPASRWLREWHRLVKWALI